MSAFYATGRLLWRPASFMLVIPIVFTVVLASMELPNGPVDVVRAMRSQTITADVSAAAWRFATVLASVFGFILSGVIRELQHTTFAWTLPEVSRRLRFGRIACGIALSAALALLTVPLFGTAAVVSVFGWAWLCFALGAMALDPVLSKIESRGVPAILVLIAFRPAYLEEVAAAAPIVFAIVASAAAIALARREFSRAIVRRRPGIPTLSALRTGSEQVRQHWQRTSIRDTEWRIDLSGGNLLRWWRAGLYEGLGGNRAGTWSVALMQLGITVIVAYFSDNPLMVVFFPWIFMHGQAQLYTKLLYPLSRSYRATLFFFSSLVESLRAVALGIAGLAILYVIGYPVEKLADANVVQIGVMLLSFAAWAPISHWSKVRGPFDATLSGKRAGWYFGTNMIYLSLAIVSAQSLLYLIPSDRLALAVLTALLIVTHGVLWLALRRRFATSDLFVAQ